MRSAAVYRLCAGAALFAGCNGPEPVPPPKLMDTGWFDEDTIEAPPPCEDKFATSTPEDGDIGWYWRDRPVAFTQTAVREEYAAWLVDESTGGRIDPELVWDEATGLSFTLEWDGFLVGDTDYTLYLQDCDSTQEVQFRTGPLGAPLEVSTAQLVGRTYLLDLAGATWVEPAALSGIIQLYFTTPILLGVRFADGESIDLLGAPGVVDTLGVVTQDRAADTWNFPLADFSEAPFLDAQAPAIALTYDAYGTDVVIPVEDFLLQGTFAADGSRIGGGVLEGFGDTRELGALLGDDRPEAICELASGLGVSCLECADGLSYCLKLRAVAVEAEYLPGLELVQR